MASMYYVLHRFFYDVTADLRSYCDVTHSGNHSWTRKSYSEYAFQCFQADRSDRSLNIHSSTAAQTHNYYSLKHKPLANEHFLESLCRVLHCLTLAIRGWQLCERFVSWPGNGRNYGSKYEIDSSPPVLPHFCFTGPFFLRLSDKRLCADAAL